MDYWIEISLAKTMYLIIGLRYIQNKLDTTVSTAHKMMEHCIMNAFFSFDLFIVYIAGKDNNKITELRTILQRESQM